MSNNLAIALLLMPSLCFSRIAAIDALAMRSVCFWRPSVALLLQLHREGWGDLGVGIFASRAFLPKRLQVVLGAVARDTVILPQGHFYSTSSGHPRVRRSGHCNLADSAILQYVFRLSSGTAKRDRTVSRSSSGPLPFLPQGHFRKRKDGPRATGGFASRAFSPLTKADLGGHISPDWDFETPPDGPRGCAKRQTLFSHHLKTDLGAVLKGGVPFRTTSRQTSGYSFGLQPFLYPSRPLPDFPVHRGHRISTYRLPIDNSLSFPCLDGQC